MAKLTPASAFLYSKGLGIEEHLEEVKLAIAKIPSDFILSDERCFPLISNYIRDTEMKEIHLAYAFDKGLLPNDTSRISGISINPALPGIRKVAQVTIANSRDVVRQNTNFEIGNIKFILLPHAYNLHNLDCGYITPKENYASRKTSEN